MSRQGYLILHEKRQDARIYFFSLEDGHLRYYTSPPSTSSTVPYGEVQLSGCKIVVKAQRRNDNIPNSFYLEARKVFVKDRSYTLGNAIRLEFTACSNEDRQEWGKALFSWQRYYWRDPLGDDQERMEADQLSSKCQLQQLMYQYYPNIATTPTSSSSSTNQSTNHTLHLFSPANLSVKQPLKFLRRNASSLRRSFTTYMPSSTRSTNSKVNLTPGPEGTDCVKEKIVLATMSYEPPERGDNQQEYYA